MKQSQSRCHSNRKGIMLGQARFESGRWFKSLLVSLVRFLHMVKEPLKTKRGSIKIRVDRSKMIGTHTLIWLDNQVVWIQLLLWIHGHEIRTREEGQGPHLHPDTEVKPVK